MSRWDNEKMATTARHRYWILTLTIWSRHHVLSYKLNGAVDRSATPGPPRDVLLAGTSLALRVIIAVAQ
jgi:hypothetical protein